MNKTPLTSASLFLILLQVLFGGWLLLPSDAIAAAQTNEARELASDYSLSVVSLRVLQDRLKNCRRKGDCSPEVLHFGGLTRVLGYIIDKPRRDILLFGQVEPGKPILHIDDLVVALRNVRRTYAPLRGNTYYYDYPGCSIDPDPSIVGQLDDIQRRTQSNPGQNWANQISRWDNVCRAPQQVRVFGIPFNSRFARTMVQADYDMKTLVDGTDKVNLPGLVSLADRKLNDIRTGLRQNQPIAVSVGMNRFWFYPGKQHYEESADKTIVFFAESAVELLTEDMYLSNSGKFVGGHRPDDQAHQFAADLSRLYDKLAVRRPIYQELDGLFRFFALAQVINDRAVPDQVGLDLTYLFSEYPISETAVETRLPGRSGHRQLKDRRESAQGYTVLELWMPSCGGVSIRIPKDQGYFKQDKLGQLAALRNHVLASHPANQLYSTVAASADLLQIKRRNRIRRLNDAGRYYNIVSIEKKAGGFAVIDRDGSEYEVKSAREFAQRFEYAENAEAREVVYLKLIGFPTELKEEAFVTSANISLAQRKLRSLSLVDDAVSQGLARKGDPTPTTQVKEGAYKGWFTAAFSVVTVTATGRVKQLVIHVYAKSRELLEEFLTIFGLRMQTDLAAGSLLDVVNAVRQDLKKKYSKSDDELKVFFEDEAGDVQIVIRHRAADRGQG